MSVADLERCEALKQRDVGEDGGRRRARKVEPEEAQVPQQWRNGWVAEVADDVLVRAGEEKLGESERACWARRRNCVQPDSKGERGES